MKFYLDAEIDKAQKACVEMNQKRGDGKTSLVDIMRPFSRLHNLLWVKAEQLNQKEKNMNIITRINEVFGGEVLNKSRTHINSICRIAYVGYLREVIGLRVANIVDVTDYTLGTTKDRLQKHRQHYEFDKIYKDNFDKLKENEN